MKVDVYSHIFPRKYLAAVQKKAGLTYSLSFSENIPTLHDLDARFRIMDKFPDVVQVLTMTHPAVERIAGPEDAAELARISNDEMAELVFRYPDRFVAGIANLPMNNIDAALEETDRAIKELKFKGVQIYTNVNGEPLDSPKFKPLYEKMAGYNLPILIHPDKDPVSDYATEDRSKYGLNACLGWPYETSLAMARLVYGGVLESYPKITFITHHCGGMVPFFIERIRKFFHSVEMRLKTWNSNLSRHPVDYFRMFYNDTAVEGNTSALMCGHAFFGAEHMLFGTDMPYDCQLGEFNIREVIRSVEEMDIPESDKKKIFEDNARRLLRLPV
ncbi:MAG: amidohydrolase family protein [Syntrophales bacterium LBB04]|nr:amidohydrolase family protein [Syntrophales bacterium LBB04]